MIHNTNNITFPIEFQIFYVCGNVIFIKTAATFEHYSYGRALAAESANKLENCRWRFKA